MLGLVGGGLPASVAAPGRSTYVRPLQMDRKELERMWAATAKHLNAARAQLPEVPAPGLDGATVSGFDECLRHNEMELALDELEDLGLTNAPPADFWQHLIFAAESMELSERAADFERRMGNAEA